MLATAVVLSALQTYVIVGVLSCLVLPRTRAALLFPMQRHQWRHMPKVAYVAFCMCVTAIASVAWPWLLKRAYLQPVVNGAGY